MTYYMYFIQTLIIRCTFSEILAEIDHKGPNWTFLTLKMTFYIDSIPFIFYDRIGFTTKKLLARFQAKLVLGLTIMSLDQLDLKPD